jgi:hypothetical protein
LVDVVRARLEPVRAMAAGRDRAERADAPGPAPDGLEHIGRTRDVDLRAEDGILTDERHLQRGEMDHACDRILVEDALEGAQVRDVDLDVSDQRLLVVAEGDGQAMTRTTEIQSDDLVAAFEQAAHRPDADRAERAGDQDAPRAAGRCRWLRRSARYGRTLSGDIGLSG